jgi:hypothetical protein
MSGNNTPNPNALPTTRSEKNALFQATFSQKPVSLPGSASSQPVPVISSPSETSGRKQYATPTSVNYGALHTTSAPLTITNPSAAVPTGMRAAEGIEQQAGSLEEMDLLD